MTKEERDNEKQKITDKRNKILNEISIRNPAKHQELSQALASLCELEAVLWELTKTECPDGTHACECGCCPD